MTESRHLGTAYSLRAVGRYPWNSQHCSGSAIAWSRSRSSIGARLLLTHCKNLALDEHVHGAFRLVVAADTAGVPAASIISLVRAS